MKLSGKCLFLVLNLSIVIFVACWTWLQSYLEINPRHYGLQGVLIMTPKTDTDIFLGNTARQFDNAQSDSKTLKSSFPEFHPSFNTFSSVKNQSKTDISSATEPYVLLNISTPVKENYNIIWYISSGNFRRGRLGNQMFIYASLLGMAFAQNRKVVMEHNTSLENTFNLQIVSYDESVKNWTAMNEASPVSFEPKFMKLPLTNVHILGYLQSFVYFSDIMDIVRQEFTFRENISNAAADIVNDVRAKYRTSLIVGVHARRGDFIKRGEKKGFGVPQKSYFLKAFDWMRSTFPGRNITFIIASDDLPWCQANLTGNDVVVMPPATPAVHLAVLSSCDHVIISGGTFGWWAGWLAGGKVIYYTGYMAKGTGLGNRLTPEQYYPRLWIGMGN